MKFTRDISGSLYFRWNFMSARFLAIFLFSHVCTFSDGGASDAHSDLAMNLDAKADMVIDFDPERKTVDLGITQFDPSDGSRRRVRFGLDDLKFFFDSRKHKNHIVIVFEKVRVPRSEMKLLLDSLKEYFVDRGFQRVTVQQHYATGRSTYLDYNPAVNAAEDSE